MKIELSKANAPSTFELPDAYYEPSNKGYWVRDAAGIFMQVTEASLRKRLKQAGVVSIPPELGANSELDESLIQIQDENRIFYAGALAGHFMGCHEIEGRKILVTESPRLIEPADGDWSVLETLIENLLGEDQQLFFFGWLKVAYEALRSGKHRPGQALVIAGERNCGKSLLQKIVTEVLGGRSAKPYQFMMDGTGFNSDLFVAEHLVIDDEAAKTKIQQRRDFGAKLKNITTDPKHRCHGKNLDALMLAPFWRLSITVNDEPENLMVLPPIDESLVDKLILLKATKREMPMPTFSTEERDKFWTTLVGGIPSMLLALMEWDIPPELRSGRYGITHYHHPEILSALEELQPEARLLALLDATLFRKESEATPVRMRSEDFEITLKDGIYGEEARKLFTFYRACGTYLSRLSIRHPERVQQKRIKGETTWIVFPPPEDSSASSNVTP